MCVYCIVCIYIYLYRKVDIFMYIKTIKIYTLYIIVEIYTLYILCTANFGHVPFKKSSDLRRLAEDRSTTCPWTLGKSGKIVAWHRIQYPATSIGKPLENHRKTIGKPIGKPLETMGKP